MTLLFQRTYGLLIQVVSILFIVCFITGCDSYSATSDKNKLPIVYDGSYISRYGDYGSGPLDSVSDYGYERRQRIVQSDNAPLSLPKFNAIKQGMIREQVQAILRIPPYNVTKDGASWETDVSSDFGPFISVDFDPAGHVTHKRRNFDGEHESSERWNQFWRVGHELIPNEPTS